MNIFVVVAQYRPHTHTLSLLPLPGVRYAYILWNLIRQKKSSLSFPFPFFYVLRIMCTKSAQRSISSHHLTLLAQDILNQFHDSKSTAVRTLICQPNIKNVNIHKNTLVQKRGLRRQGKKRNTKKQHTSKSPMSIIMHNPNLIIINFLLF